MYNKENITRRADGNIGKEGAGEAAFIYLEQQRIFAIADIKKTDVYFELFVGPEIIKRLAPGCLACNHEQESDE